MGRDLICYRARNLSSTELRRLHRVLYGYKDYSNGGLYTYRRKGLVDGRQCKRVIDGVLITSTQASRAIIQVLRKHGVKASIFTVQ